MKVGVYKAWEVIVLCEVGEISTFGSEDCVKVGCEDYVESEGCTECGIQRKMQNK